MISMASPSACRRPARRATSWRCSKNHPIDVVHVELIGIGKEKKKHMDYYFKDI